MLALFDKFLKKLGTDRNTFISYILLLITSYICIDRICEILIMIFSGISVSYWNPIVYAFALACPMFTMLIAFASKFASSKQIKVVFFNVNYVALYIIAISMFMQWINSGIWLLLFHVPNFTYIATYFPDVLLRATKSISLILPVVTLYPAIKQLYGDLDDTTFIIESIWDYRGIDLSDGSVGTGAYTCEVYFGKDRKSGKGISIPENRRYEPMVVVGISGMGKTACVFEPMMARDLEKKFFFRETSKELAFTALKTGIANLNCPYDNDYINNNFSLNMISPNSYKKEVYKTFMKKLILYSSDDEIIYKNLGFTYIAPDFDTLDKIATVAKNFKIPVNIIDPVGTSTIGLNPFAYDDPLDTAVAFSTVIQGMYHAMNSDFEEAFKTIAAKQSLENLCILLKLMYPKMHEGSLPTLEDLLRMLNNFDLVEKMCNLLELDEELSQKYESMLNFFKKYFYAGSSGRDEAEKNVFAAITQIESLLRYPGVKEILCNRTNNLTYNNVLENGEITLFCARRGDLGPTESRAFGLFFLLMMDNSILKRKHSEEARIPHYLYIDDFPTYLCGRVKSIFTLYRKYHVGIIISAQNRHQFGKDMDTIMSNSTTRIVFGGNTPEDNQWWSDEFGMYRYWRGGRNYDLEKEKYEPKISSIKYDWKRYFEPGKIAIAPPKTCFYKTRNYKGKAVIGEAPLSFMDSKYKEPKPIKAFNFAKFTSGIATQTENHHKTSKGKFNPLSVTRHFDEDSDVEIDPIQTDTTDSQYIFNNEDAIIVNIKKKKQ